MNTFTSTSVSPKRVAEILRAARNLMNNNGRHWVKGTEKTNMLNVDPKTRFDKGNNYYDGELGQQEYAYCSIGALKEVVGNNYEEYKAALFELALYINEDRVFEYAEEVAYDNFNDENPSEYTYDTPPNIDKLNKNEIFDFVDEDFLGDIIAEENDADQTIWKDVSGWFTKTATRVSKRKL